MTNDKEYREVNANTPITSDNYGGALNPDFEYAGFWSRFGARIIDGIILAVVGAIIGFIIGIFGSIFALIGLIPMNWLLGDILLFVIGIFISVAYFSYMESSSGQATFGKKAFNLKVADTDGNRISFGNALIRSLSKEILLITAFIIGFTAKKQGIHDLISNTVVLKQS